MALILIDGVDLTGKSSLAERLSRRYEPPAAVVHHSGPPTTGSSWAEYVWSVTNWYRPACGCHLVVDRSFPSEWVWSKIFGRWSDIESHDEFILMARALRGAGAVHVHARLPAERIEALMSANPDEPLAAHGADGVGAATMLYDQLYALLRFDGDYVMEWDRDASPAAQDAAVDAITKRANAAEAKAAIAANARREQ